MDTARITTRPFPALGTDVGAIGLGCMGMSWAYGSSEDRDADASVDVIREALDLGITLVDTSDAYAAGRNEELVARAIAGRDDVVLATKAGLVARAENGPGLDRDGRPEHLRAACDASLRRLGVDAIDLYYLHRVDPEVPLAESWGALAGLVAAGKVRSIGLSEVTVDQADLAQAIHPVAAIQSELSLWTRDPLGVGANADGAPTGDVVGWTRAHDAIFVPFSPLGRGFLTGELDTKTLTDGDMRSRLPRFSGEAANENERIVDAVRVIAARHDTTAAAVALAWVLAQGDHVVPIPGTTKSTHLHANAAATRLALTADDLATLDALPPATGTRY